MRTRASRKRKKQYYNSRDSIGFVFRKLDKSEDNIDFQEETTDTVMPDSEPSCEPSVIESLNPSSEAVLNEDTLQNNPTLLKDKLKQFEVDNFVKKLMKRWSSLNPDTDASTAEKKKETLTDYLMTSETLWSYYEEESDTENASDTEYFEKRIHVMQSEQKEWEETVTAFCTESETRKHDLSTKWTPPTQPTSSTSPANDVQENIRHVKNVAEALDKEYSRLFDELSQQCDEYEERLSKKEADVKVRYDEVATPYTLLTRASRVTEKLQALK